MRDTRGLVDSLVGYIQNSLQEGKAEDKVSSENESVWLKRSVCLGYTRTCKNLTDVKKESFKKSL